MNGRTTTNILLGFIAAGIILPSAVPYVASLVKDHRAKLERLAEGRKACTLEQRREKAVAINLSNRQVWELRVDEAWNEWVRGGRRGRYFPPAEPVPIPMQTEAECMKRYR